MERHVTISSSTDAKIYGTIKLLWHLSNSSGSFFMTKLSSLLL